MGLCFGKPCAESSAPVRHSSPVPMEVHRKRSLIEISPEFADPGNITGFQDLDHGHRHTFRDLLSKKAEQAFDPVPAPPVRRPSGGISSRDSGIRRNSPVILQKLPSSTLRHHLKDYDDELPIFDSSGQEEIERNLPEEKRGEETEEKQEEDGEHCESFSSYRGATTFPSMGDNSKTMVIGNGTPVIPDIAAYVALCGSSSEIIEETGSESSISKVRITYNYHRCRKRIPSMSSSITSSSTSSSGRQDVVSLEFLDEFCRIPGVTSHSSSCSEEPGNVKQVQTLDTGSRAYACSSSSTASASEEESREVRPKDVSFLDFLCSQGQAAISSCGKSKTGSLSSSPGSSKKRPSTSRSSFVSETTTKKARVDGLNKRMESLKLCPSPESTVAGRRKSLEQDTSSPHLKKVPGDRRDSRPSPKHGGEIKSPPSTPGSFRSTPFASVGSSFSVDDGRRSVSTCTPLSAAPSFTSTAALSPEEMTAIWSAFQEGQLSQQREPASICL